MTTNDTDELDDTSPAPTAGGPTSARRAAGRMLIASIRGHRRIARGAGILAVAAIIGAAYVVGGPPAGAHSDTTFDSRNALTAQIDQKDLQLSGPMPAATAAPAAPAYAGDGTIANGGTTTGNGGQAAVVSSLDATQIVKTGQMTLEVAGIDDAVSHAQAAIAGLGGVVDSSNRYGTGDNTVASITFRVPVAKWDEALADMRKIASKILSEQTGATDVTTQVVDIDARLSNLQATETALQAIMARASAIPDVLAVENQLSDTQGQIEELTAESKHLKDQAAMSTLSVSFQLPSKTVTTAATEDWTLAGQIDQAGAALVRIGQGLATIGVWIVVVVLPVALVLAVLLAIGLVFRRVRGRGRRGQVAAA
jgi:Domain of unknown function (DUF4349)